MIVRIARQYAHAAALTFLLTACASVPPPATPTGQSPSSAIAQAFHDTIDLSGRLSVRYQGNNKEEAVHGSFTWSQSSAQTIVTLLSPLGQTMAVIEVTPNGATLAQSGQPVRTATDVNTLTASTLGWPLPVAGLRDWLQGFALDTNGRRFIAAPSASEVTTQDGWRIRYANWISDNASPAQNRPKRIDLAHSTEQAGDVSIRIVIDTWQTH